MHSSTRLVVAPEQFEIYCEFRLESMKAIEEYEQRILTETENILAEKKIDFAEFEDSRFVNSSRQRMQIITSAIAPQADYARLLRSKRAGDFALTLLDEVAKLETLKPSTSDWASSYSERKFSRTVIGISLEDNDYFKQAFKQLLTPFNDALTATNPRAKLGYVRLPHSKLFELATNKIALHRALREAVDVTPTHLLQSLSLSGICVAGPLFEEALSTKRFSNDNTTR